MHIIVCYGNTKLTDERLASTIHAIDDEIFESLARRVSDVPKEKAARKAALNFKSGVVD